MSELRFLVGGPTEPLYEYLASKGFTMSNHSVKVWARADGVVATIYGTGSRLQINGCGVDIADTVEVAIATLEKVVRGGM